MGDVISFRDAKKAKSRADKEAAASANRAKFGRTKDERTAEEARRERLDKTLDGARRETPPDEPA
jgi:hypothetical protein